MHQIFQNFIDSLAESSDEQALRLTMEVAAAALDLACFAYLALPRAAGGGARLISNYPTQWTTHYLQSHYERLDPVVAQALGDSEPFEFQKVIMRKYPDLESCAPTGYGECNGVYKRGNGFYGRG